MKNVMYAMLATAAVAGFVACGGGGGGGSSRTVYYPYETVYGDLCQNEEPTPGCTFDRNTGLRVTVTADPHYNDYGHGSDDLWYVKFDGGGQAAVYDDLGRFRILAQMSLLSQVISVEQQLVLELPVCTGKTF